MNLYLVCTKCENSPENYYDSLSVTYTTMEATIYLLRAMF